MTNTPAPLDPIAQLVAKYQSNSHQTAPTEPQPASQPQRRKSWTGFAERTLWDWLNLLGVLLVPLVLGAGTILITAQQSALSQSQHESDLSIANTQFQEALLKTFRDDISRLVFDQHLLTAKHNDPVQIMAQSYTNDALRKLDLSRRVLLVRFLSDLHLIVSTSTITKDSALISLVRADLGGADLRGVDLHGEDLLEANLHGADLRGADLHGADLGLADLHGADLGGAEGLVGADLRGAELFGANLSGANLVGANLSGADLWVADLRGAELFGEDLNGAFLFEVNLGGADLRYADLRGADLLEADLRGADLRRADLGGAHLSGAHLGGAKVTPEDLALAYSLQGVILPDGSHYPSRSYPIPNHHDPTQCEICTS